MGALAAGPEDLRSMQELFDTTGAVHAAGVLDSDGAVVLAEKMSVVAMPSTRWWADSCWIGRFRRRTK